MRKNVKGITLVALVITIILLLILAGITISSLTGSGLFENAKLAEQKSKEAQEKEDKTLNDYEDVLEGYINNNRETVTITKEEYEQMSSRIAELENSKLDMQMGVVETGAIPVGNGVDVEITFLKEMANTNYMFNAVMSDVGNGWANCEYRIVSKTTTSCTIRVFNNNTVTEPNSLQFEWTVIGKQL